MFAYFFVKMEGWAQEEERRRDEELVKGKEEGNRDLSDPKSYKREIGK